MMKRLARLAMVAFALPTLGWGATVRVQVVDAAGRPLEDAAVFLESRAARGAVRPLQGVEMAQVGRQFEPRVLVVPVGTAVAFPNRDTVRHHVYSFSPAKNFEIKLYIGSAVPPVVFDRPGIAVLGCNIHDNMVAWVVVAETPYVARSGEGGQAVIENVPSGAYRLRVWHPGQPVGAPAADQALTVGSSDTQIQYRLAIARP